MTLRTLRRSIATLIVLSLLPIPAFAAGRNERRLTWAQAATLVRGEHVEVELTDRQRVWGFALNTSSDVLRIEIVRTTAPSLYPPGINSISASLLTRIKLRPPQYHWRRDAAEQVGFVIGGVAVAPLAFYLGEAKNAPDWALGLLAAGAALTGFLVARRITADSPLIIRIVPDLAGTMGGRR